MWLSAYSALFAPSRRSQMHHASGRTQRLKGHGPNRKVASFFSRVASKSTRREWKARMSISPATGRPGDAESLFEQASALCRAGRFAEAERTFRRVLEIEPRHCDALHFLGMVCGQLGNHAEALRHLDAALRID